MIGSTAEDGAPPYLARAVGLASLLLILTGIFSAIFVSHGIDINLTAETLETANAMLEAETRLRAKAYIQGFGFCLEVFIALGFFSLLRRHGELLAGWSLIAGVAAALLALLGGFFAINAAEIASRPDYDQLAGDSGKLMLVGLQATSDYSSFHFSLVLSSLVKAAIFFLLYRSAGIPRVISAFGVFASLYVAIAMVSRDFIPVIGTPMITASFMICNLIAMLSLAIYLSIWGLKPPAKPPSIS